MAAIPGDHFRAGGEHSACSTPFISAPSSPARDPSFHALATAGFYSAPASPAARGAGDDEYGCELDFDFDFSSQLPSPAVEVMSSADELFHNGQIRPMRLSSFLLRRQAPPPPLASEVAAPHRPVAPTLPNERGRLVRRRSRSQSPFRLPHCFSPAASSGDPSAASRSSSSSSTASSASSSSLSSHHRRWRYLKELLHRSSSSVDGGGGKHHPPVHSPPPPQACKKNASPAAKGQTRGSTHAQIYQVRRVEAEESRRRTFLPYRQGLLLGCLGLGSRSYGALAAAAKSRA